MGFIGDIFGGGGGSTTQSGYTNIDKDTTQTTDNFSTEQSRKQFNDYLKAAKNNYNQANTYKPQIQNTLNNMNKTVQEYQKNKGGDTSYFKQAWGQAQGIDQSNLNKLNTQSLDPNDNSAWVKAMNDIDNNARLGWGQYNNQLMQNMIGSNMANGSGHQTAAARQSMMLNSQLAADRANRWQQQYNQNVQNTLAANNQLGNFYNTLANLGIDYAKLSQQDLSTLLNAYSQQAGMYDLLMNGSNDAQKLWGQAVAMDTAPKTETHEHKEGTESQTQESQKSGADTMSDIGQLALLGMKFFGA